MTTPIHEHRYVGNKRIFPARLYSAVRSMPYALLNVYKQSIVAETAFTLTRYAQRSLLKARPFAKTHPYRQVSVLRVDVSRYRIDIYVDNLFTSQTAFSYSYNEASVLSVNLWTRFVVNIHKQFAENRLPFDREGWSVMFTLGFQDRTHVLYIDLCI